MPMLAFALTILLCAAPAAQGQTAADGADSLQTLAADGATTLIYQAPGRPAVLLQRTERPVADAAVVERAGVVAVTWSELRADGSLQPWYRISLDGGASFGRARETSYELQLNYANFDPLADGEPAIANELRARGGNELYIVQYITQGLEPWRDEIRALGAVDHRFLAWHANIWRMDAATAARVAELPFVRWVGAFHPAYKLEPVLLGELRGAAAEARRYRLVAGEWGPAQKAILADRVRALGARVDAMIDEGWILEATLDRAQLLDVLQQPELLGVDRWSAPEDDMDNVRALMGGNYLESLTGFDGSGVRAEDFDSGFDIGRPEWRHAPVLHGSVGNSSHGTSTYSINFADTTSATRGMAPDAQGIMADYGSYGGNRYTHTAQLQNPPYEAVYQTNSWGDARTRSYTSVSQQMDDIIFINDMVITQSQSNAGNQDSRPQAWAKNIVAVGGIRHYNNQNNADDAWAGGASIGPAADGRIKPDLSAFYDSVNTVNNSSFGGTSAASPIVAGHFALFFEMWHNGLFGNTPGASVFASRPHSTTSRALMINSAWQWPDNQTDITRFSQGWGRPDLRYMYDNASSMFWVDEADVLANLASKSYALDVAAGTPEFRATLVYLDPAGTTSASLHRINDLSLQVTDPSGVVYWGNNGLSAGSYNASTPGGSSNVKDVVEQVLIPNPATGTWTVTVHADELNQDAHVETGALDADYALVVSGVVGGGGGGFTLSVASGTCPGAMSFQVSGGTGGGQIAWVYGLPGSTTHTGGTCNGIQLDLASLTVYSIGTATTLNANVPAGACGVYRLQCVDVASCTVSNFLDL